ncbi:hypothetical protein KBD69_04035 [Candidatus Woesebacteria bacterium]|nr:hypothetical protein [Candidatus Woesebacteria bacterium]
MKKPIGPSFEKEFKTPCLYLDDLQEIENIFLIELKAKYYDIRTDNYKYNSFKEISTDYKGSISELRIGSFTPDIRISLTQSSAGITCNDHELESIGAAGKIYEIIRRRERRVYWFWFERLYYLLLASPLLPYVNIFLYKWLAYAIILLIGIIAISLFMRLTNMYKASKIVLLYTRDKENFFSRNKDQIMLVILGTIFGVLGTIVTTTVGLKK